MSNFIKNIYKVSVLAIMLPGIVFAVQQQNPRGANSKESARSADSISNAAVRRSATSVIARSAGEKSRKSRAVVTARPMTARSASVRSVRNVVSGSSVARSASKPSLARSGTKQQSGSTKNLSRAATARATAVFNDVSKIGGGYAGCRDAYATCMDQFCANANDTYRRCYCSDRFTEFRDLSDRMDDALGLLADFQNNNLEAVNKSAAEVNAMYTASEGEAAIKRDTSASQQMLDSISAILSGKKTVEKSKPQSSSLGVLDFSTFASFTDDVFGDNSGIFGAKPKDSSYVDMSTLEGKELFDNAVKQCGEITRDACNSDAMFNLARSSYSILITQDCNAYEKNINAKKASVEETVRTAEKYLREARLEEYRSHNSADVNECLAEVDKAMRQSTACGENYEKCLDYSGQYINASTGEPIFSQALFGLNSLIILDGSADVLNANPQFEKFLEEKKMFVTTALDSCRDISKVVWEEYKRSAIIKIAQAQDDKIQQIKDSCVATVKKCYDKQTGDLKSIDDTEMQSTDAIAAVTARGMCYDRVQACAALYGDPDGCVYDDATKKLTPNGNKKCGLQSLLAFVDTVDSVKVAEGCEAALTKYAAQLCPDSELKPNDDGNYDIPTLYTMQESVIYETSDGKKMLKYGSCAKMPKGQLRAAMNTRMDVFCAQDLVKDDESNTISNTASFNLNILNNVVKSVYDKLGIAFTEGCENKDGIWIDGGGNDKPKIEALLQDFYQTFYGVTIRNLTQIDELNLPETGWCIKADGLAQCEALGSNYAIYNTKEAKCELQPAWFSDKCAILGGSWDGGMCTVNNVEGLFDQPMSISSSENPDVEFAKTAARSRVYGRIQTGILNIGGERNISVQSVSRSARSTIRRK